MDQAAQHAQAFLAPWEITFDDLVAFVRPLTSREALLLVGSVPNGLANPLSDIDLVLLGDAGLNHQYILSESDLEYGTTMLNGHEVHVECWLTRDLEALGDKLSRRDPLSKSQLCVLDRVWTGAVLANRAAADSWRDRLQLHGLAAYLQDYWLEEYDALATRTRQEAAGGDLVTMQWLLRLTYSTVCGALLAALGETNTYAKWRPRLLARHRARLGDSRYQLLVRQLFTGPISEPGQVDRALADAAGLADAIRTGAI